MPIVEHIELPSFQTLREQGEEVLSLDDALTQDIREMHVGLLNMMPDAALKVTEQQFIRLVGSCNQIVQFYVHPFTVEGMNRSPETQAYIDKYYMSIDDIYADGLDALIITGANVSNPHLEQEPFWNTLTEVMGWAVENVTSVLCSCLSTHALMKHFYDIDRQRMRKKQWGVYQHRVTSTTHPLLRNINTRFDVPHSRWNDVSRQQFEDAGLTILIDSGDVGVHMAVSPDQFRRVYFQGHPEYDYNSLLKEYKRDVMLFLNGEDYKPPHPENYFTEDAGRIADAYIDDALRAQAAGEPLPDFPEKELEWHLDNTWTDTGKAIFNNWLGLVYKLTHVDRRIPFADWVDPKNPLEML